LALAFPVSQRHQIEEAFAGTRGALSTADWNLIAHLADHRVSDFALLLSQVPDLLDRSPQVSWVPALRLTDNLDIIPGRQTETFAALLAQDDVETLGLIVDTSPTRLTLENLLRQFQELSAPAVAPPTVTETELREAQAALESARGAYDRGSAAFNQGQLNAARTSLQQALTHLARLVRQTEAILEQAMESTQSMSHQEEWLDLYSAASNLHEAAGLTIATLPLPTEAPEEAPPTQAELSRIDAVPDHPVRIRRSDGEVFDVYINEDYRYFNRKLFLQHRDKILKRLLFYIDNPNHVSFQEGGPMSNIKRVKVEGDQFRAYVYTLQPNTILIHAFGTTGSFKVDRMALQLNFKNEMIRRNDWHHRSEVTETSIEPWIYPQTGSASTSTHSPSRGHDLDVHRGA